MKTHELAKSLAGKMFGPSGREFRLITLLDTGGYGAVYKATQMSCDRTVAVKVALMDLDDPDDGKRRRKHFDREIRIVSGLQDPHTVKLLDVGSDKDTGLYFMVFEYIDGVTLSTVMRNEGAFSPSRVIGILRQVLESLEEAHSPRQYRDENGVVRQTCVIHRDLKPDNIMLYNYMNQKRADRVKVLDFGVSKIMGEATTTTSMSLVGTPKYMSPEQVRLEELGPPSDIFSLGLVAYYMLAGRHILPDSSSMEVFISAVSSRAPFGLPERFCEESPGLRAIVEKMLEKDLLERYQNAEEVLEALDTLGDAKTTVEKPPGRFFDTGYGDSLAVWALVGLGMLLLISGAAFWGPTLLESTSEEPAAVELPRLPPGQEVVFDDVGRESPVVEAVPEEVVLVATDEVFFAWERANAKASDDRPVSAPKKAVKPSTSSAKSKRPIPKIEAKPELKEEAEAKKPKEVAVEKPVSSTPESSEKKHSDGPIFWGME